MGRLIDADRLLNDVRKHSASYFADDFAHEWVDQQPTVDAVEVVRCKDCMHYGFTDNRIPEEQVWWCYFWDDVRSPDAYCSDGEREDSEHETD